MSTATVRLVTGLVLIIHGIGHAMAFVPALNIFSNENWHTRSWLLNSVLGDTASRVIIIVLFAIPLIGFIAAGMGVFNWVVPHEWWPRLAIVSAVVGMIALVIFWNAFASLFPNKVGAIAVNIAVLWGLLGSNALSQMLAEI
ncbi:MAG: hypothetical protein H6662_13860 [Ardenticatenaceae bacterium]|nr:hypothetical protein [Anaerolineales bacterium]MCB8922667.1 hypothetical protein [Ardenticatenaceae bacterium]MCB8991786.1 hypothetical protein [Ardenticatenaceae bacterium]MCB9003625.1 hypothetical protein [Ardenticatenaceae bacterium]